MTQVSDEEKLRRLAERLALGEISEETYQSAAEAVRGAGTKTGRSGATTIEFGQDGIVQQEFHSQDTITNTTTNTTHIGQQFTGQTTIHQHAEASPSDQAAALTESAATLLVARDFHGAQVAAENAIRHDASGCRASFILAVAMGGGLPLTNLSISAAERIWRVLRGIALSGDRLYAVPALKFMGALNRDRYVAQGLAELTPSIRDTIDAIRSNSIEATDPEELRLVSCTDETRRLMGIPK